MAISVPIISEFQPKGINKAIADFQRLDSAGKKAGFALKKAFLPATAALAGLAAGATLAVKAAVEDQAQQEELARQIEATTGATEAQIAANEQFIAQMEMQVAISDGALRPALANLVRGTQDLTKAQDLLSIALDVSAATGKDLNAVTEAMAKAAQGEMTALKRLDPSLTAVIKSGADANEVFAAMADTFGGAAQEHADTLQGRFQRLKVQMDNAAESIGYALLPMVETLVPLLERMATFVGDNAEIMVPLAAVVGTLAGAIVAMNIALGVWNTLSAIAAIMTANLAGTFTTLWVATGVGIIVAIIAAVVLLQAKFGLFNPIIDGLKWLFDALWSSIKFQINLVIDVVNLLISAINKIKPGDDIPKIPKLMDDIATAANNSRTAIDKTSGRMKHFEGQIGSLSDAVYEGTTRVDELDQAFFYWSDKVIGAGDAIDRARGKLNEFYDLLDRRKTLRDLAEDIATIQSEMDDLMPGTDAYQAKWEEIALLFGALDESVSRLPKQYELDLVLAGDWDTLLMALEVANAPLFGPGEEQFVGGTMRGGLTVGAPNITINMPAGSDGAEVVRTLEREARLRGSLPLRTAAGIKL